MILTGEEKFVLKAPKEKQESKKRKVFEEIAFFTEISSSFKTLRYILDISRDFVKS
jgi:hypothetical protein